MCEALAMESVSPSPWHAGCLQRKHCTILLKLPGRPFTLSLNVAYFLLEAVVSFRTCLSFSFLLIIRA